MKKLTITTGELMAFLSKYPAETPIFGYSEMDECDSCCEVAEFFAEPPKETVHYDDGDETYINAPYYNQGDSNIEEHWRLNGETPIIILRERMFRNEETNENKLVVV